MSKLHTELKILSSYEVITTAMIKLTVNLCVFMCAHACRLSILYVYSSVCIYVCMYIYVLYCVYYG